MVGLCHRRPILLADEDLKRLAVFRTRTPNAKEDDWPSPKTGWSGPIRADKALEKVQAGATKVSISLVTWHLLRHRHTFVLHDEGVLIKAVQERLGHADAQTRMKHYVHVSQQASREAAEAASRHLRMSAQDGLRPDSGSRFSSELDIVKAKLLISQEGRGTQEA